MEIEGADKAQPARAPARPLAWLLLALLAGNVALGIGPWFVRLADTGPVAAAFWRLLLALPVLFVLARANGQRLGGMGAGTLSLVALGAAAFALDLASWHIGITMTRLGNATCSAMPARSCCCSGASSSPAPCRDGWKGWRSSLRSRARRSCWGEAWKSRPQR
jgi:hypothetical protein